MGAIFISYRREDAEGHAGRLFEDLREVFGADSVFMDVVGIEPGVDFRKTIDAKVTSCSVLLALMGRQWLDLKGPDGRRRLDDACDFVRLETAAALRRDIPVVPVLVQGAKMPSEVQLPDDLKDLAFRNGVELTHARWESDVQLLVAALAKHVQPLSKGGRHPWGWRSCRPRRPPWQRRPRQLPRAPVARGGPGRSRAVWRRPSWWRPSSRRSRGVRRLSRPIHRVSQPRRRHWRPIRRFPPSPGWCMAMRRARSWGRSSRHPVPKGSGRRRLRRAGKSFSSSARPAAAPTRCACTTVRATCTSAWTWRASA